LGFHPLDGLPGAIEFPVEVGMDDRFDPPLLPDGRIKSFPVDVQDGYT
jgi:hypothetical protein